MLGVFLFVLFFVLFYLFIGLPTHRKTRVISLSEDASPTPSAQEDLKSADDGMPWWVKIVTETPQCTYFFGPFDSLSEAKHHQSGYIEDLEHEGARGIVVLILQDRPETLTIYDDDED